MSFFANKVAVVTGGGSGIGRALVFALTERGARVVVADVDAESAEAVASEADQHPGKAWAQTLDVTDPDAFDAVIEDTVSRARRVDLLFNNAGIGVAGDARDHTRDDWERVIDVNLWGVINGIRATYPVMIRQNAGHIVNTASVAGFLPVPGFVAYAATKHAVVGISKAMRPEAARLGVRVSVLCPSITRTPILDNTVLRSIQSGERVRAIGEYTRGMPVGTPERVARDTLRGVEKNRALILPRDAGLLWRVWRWWPGLVWCALPTSRSGSRGCAPTPRSPQFRPQSGSGTNFSLDGSRSGP